MLSGDADVRHTNADRLAFLNACRDDQSGQLMACTRAIIPWARAEGDDEDLDDAIGDEDGDEGGEDRAETAPSGRTSVIASTATPDRYGDIIVQAGWELDNYRNAPVVMPWHNYNSLAVGRGESVGLNSDGNLAMDIVWDTGWKLGRDLARQYSEGFMRGVSVGFRPLEFVERSSLDKEDPQFSERGFLIQGAELLELSAAPVPVQQEALAAKAIGASSDADVLAILCDAIDRDPRVRRAIRSLVRAMKISRPETHALRGDDALAALIGC
jgi:hypothetical protein